MPRKTGVSLPLEGHAYLVIRVPVKLTAATPAGAVKEMQALDFGKMLDTSRPELEYAEEVSHFLVYEPFSQPGMLNGVGRIPHWFDHNGYPVANSMWTPRVTVVIRDGKVSRLQATRQQVEVMVCFENSGQRSYSLVDPASPGMPDLLEEFKQRFGDAWSDGKLEEWRNESG
jgi:hypothetical protein